MVCENEKRVMEEAAHTLQLAGQNVTSLWEEYERQTEYYREKLVAAGLLCFLGGAPAGLIEALGGLLTGVSAEAFKDLHPLYDVGIRAQKAENGLRQLQNNMEQAKQVYTNCLRMNHLI